MRRLQANVIGHCGPQVVDDGSAPVFRAGNTGEAIVSSLHGHYTEQALRGNLFVATSNLSELIQGYPSVTPNLAFYNPIGSQKLLSMVRFEMAISTAPTTPVIGPYLLALLSKYSADPATTPMQNNFSGITGVSQSGMGRLVAGATFTGATSQIYRMIATHYTGAVTTIPNMPAYAIDFDGTCLLSPGNALYPAQLNNDATNANAFYTFIWEEIPI